MQNRCTQPWCTRWRTVSRARSRRRARPARGVLRHHGEAAHRAAAAEGAAVAARGRGAEPLNARRGRGFRAGVKPASSSTAASFLRGCVLCTCTCFVSRSTFTSHAGSARLQRARDAGHAAAAGHVGYLEFDHRRLLFLATACTVQLARGQGQGARGARPAARLRAVSRTLRFLVTWLMLLALALQGWAAAGMLDCAGHAAASAEDAAHGHGAHHADAHAAGHSADHAASPAADPTDAQPGSCSACAACCVALALPARSPGLAEPPRTACCIRCPCPRRSVS